jgi:chromosome segregation ATPase
MTEKDDDLTVKYCEGDLHGHTFHDSINIASSAVDRHSLVSDVIHHPNEQQGQSASASLFEPLRSILSEFIIQNRQLKEQIKQLEKQSQLQYQNLTEKFDVQTKKNEELQLEIDQLKEQCIEHRTRINQLETNDQSHNTKILEIDQRHSSLERNLKSVERRVAKLAGKCLVLFCSGET